MTPKELQIFRDTSWDSGWNAALTCAAQLLTSIIVRQDATRADIADELLRLKVGGALHEEFKND